MPERWPRKLSAMRSAASTARASPSIVSSAVLAATASPSRWCAVIADRGIELAQRRLDQRQSGDRAGLARHDDGARARAFRHRRGRGDVAGAAEILGERAHHRGVDFERREERVGAEQGGHAARLDRARRAAARCARASSSVMKVRFACADRCSESRSDSVRRGFRSRRSAAAVISSAAVAMLRSCGRCAASRSMSGDLAQRVLQAVAVAHDADMRRHQLAQRLFARRRR